MFKLSLNLAQDSVIDKSLNIAGKYIETSTFVESNMSTLETFLPKLIFSIIFLFVGLKLIKFILNVLTKVLDKKQTDVSVVKFSTILLSIILKFVLFISIIGYLGIETTSMVAMAGAVGLAVGLALQGTLQNFAGGVIILVLKPFKTGDAVEFGGAKGVVREVQLFSTVIEKYGSNEILIIPNSSITSNILVNLAADRNRRADIDFGVAYGTDLQAVKDVLIPIVNSDSRVVNPADTLIYTTQLADSSVNMQLRVWCTPDDYFDFRSDMYEVVYNTLNKNNIEIPFPQITIHNS